MGVCVRVMGGSGDVPLRLHRRVVSWLSVAADRRPARSVLTSGFVVLIPDLVRSEIHSGPVIVYALSRYIFLPPSPPPHTLGSLGSK